MKKENTAVFILLLAAFVFSTSGVFNRMIGTDAGTFTALLARTIIPAVLFGAFMFVAKEKANFKQFDKQDIGLFVTRAILTLIDFLAFFYASTHMKLGLSLLVFYVSYLLSSFVYTVIQGKDKVQKKDIIALLMALLGLATIYKFDISTIVILPFLASIVSGSFYAIHSALSQPLTSKYSISLVSFVTYSLTSVLAIPCFIFAYYSGIEIIANPISITAWAGIVLAGVAAFLAFFLTLYGYKLVSVNRASLILLSEILFTFIIGLIIYGESVTLNAILGGILIVLALAVPYIPMPKIKSGNSL